MRAFMRLRWILRFIRYSRGATGFVVNGNPYKGYEFSIRMDDDEQ